MDNVFLLIAALLSGVPALLYCAPRIRLLNIVNYDGPASVERINRHAAVRLLVPVGVSSGCAYIAGTRPTWLVPLLFPAMLSILVAVVWIAAGVTRLGTR